MKSGIAKEEACGMVNVFLYLRVDITGNRLSKCEESEMELQEQQVFSDLKKKLLS